MRYSPGDLSYSLPSVPDGDVDAAVRAASNAFEAWRFTSAAERVERLRAAGRALAMIGDELAYGIALETGKPFTEAQGEVGAVVAKIELAIGDAHRFLAEFSEPDNARPNVVRRRPRGVAAVIGPFNFPLHLPHGAITAYLLAGNTVVFKPSPFAATVCGRYASVMAEAFPPGVFGVVQGAAAVGQALVADARVRAIHFTGSVPAGRAIARQCADDVSKDVALELGGKNAAVVCADADPAMAAAAVAEAMCLTAGQRCNSTSRVLVDAGLEAIFVDHLRAALGAFVPGDPLLSATRLGPLVSEAARERYRVALAEPGDWLVRGSLPDSVGNKRGHYVTPSVVRLATDAARQRLFVEEVFAPMVTVTPTRDDAEACALNNATPFGLTASVFTRDPGRFAWMADRLNVGNVYHDLPTTLSPSTLPFGGHAASGNGRPGGRGFVRFTTDEQVIQYRG
jgi:acyl-CoA reductase-like NAD-dependent aldehyde dehydrogenase